MQPYLEYANLILFWHKLIHYCETQDYTLYACLFLPELLLEEKGQQKQSEGLL